MELGRTIKLLENTDLKVVTSDEFFLPRITGGSEVFATNTMKETGTKRTVLTKTFTKDSGK